MKTSSIPLHLNVGPILGAIRAVPIPLKPTPDSPTPPPPPFITISREPYAGAWTMAQQLVQALNQSETDEYQWTCWDRELVEKVAADFHLSEEAVDAIEDDRHSWLTDFLSSISLSDMPNTADEARIYERVAHSIRKLAASGRAIIVGRGGIFITRHMPGGIHIRLVAPFEHRAAFLAQQRGIKPEEAPAILRQLDRNRLAFYKRHWPNETIGPETFAVTINTAEVDVPTMIRIIQSLVCQRVTAKSR